MKNNTLKARLLSISTSPAGSPAVCQKQQLHVPGTVYENLDQEIIHITADRAHRYLTEWLQKTEVQGAWVAPLSVGVSLLLALLTSDCKSWLGIPGDVWTAFSYIAFLAAAVWLVCSLWRCRSSAPESPDQIIEKFKNVSPP